MRKGVSPFVKGRESYCKKAISIVDATIKELKENGYADQDYLFQDIK